MKKFITTLLCFGLILLLNGCSGQTPKIGAAFGVGSATRWQQERQYMEEYAKAAGVELIVRMNTDEKVKPFEQDCMELIDTGIDVLIVRPRNVSNMKNVVDYAHQHNVEIISYDSLIEGERVDFFVGYDSIHIGQNLGRHTTELVPKGDYILVWGDKNRNVEDMYTGVMKFIEPLKNDINILLEAEVPGWSTDEAKRMIKEAITANNNKVDAIIAFNDSLAGAAAEAVAELGITQPVEITGMDAQLDAVKRVLAGTQSCTAYMDLKALADAAMNEAINLAQNKKPNANSETENGSTSPVPSYLLTRQLVTKQNLDRILIESGYYTYEEVYGATVQSAAQK